MTFDYAATAATALRLLQNFGAATTIKRHAGSAYDPATGTSTATYTTLSTTAAVFDYPAKYIDGTLIKQGDRQAYMPSTHEPKAGDKVTWGGADLTVVAVKTIAPASIIVLYEAQLRG